MLKGFFNLDKILNYVIFLITLKLTVLLMASKANKIDQHDHHRYTGKVEINKVFVGQNNILGIKLGTGEKQHSQINTQSMTPPAMLSN